MSQSDEMRFDALIRKEGKFTFVELPFSPREFWGAQPRYHVNGTINGSAVRGTLGALGHEYFLRLTAAWMRASGLESGDKVSIQLSLEER